ncbi:uncharacterized protein LOC142976221 [Anticarsia gemmatalis]|uniref:uncharacterized protein LOC142976221 n=1 Tax=Anticarsia gemmatalis TaxID=129554 RepID=UPI003F757D29
MIENLYKFLNNPDYDKAYSIHEFRVKDLKGNHIKLDVYKNHVCIIVNTASKSCFMKDHFRQFNELMEKYGETEGLRILGFPCNQFGGEPCSSKEIAKHAKEHEAKFDIYAKINVNCNHASPLYKFMKKYLRDSRSEGVIKSNFTKFIVNKEGIPVERLGPEIFPVEMENMIKYYFNN